VQEAGLIGVVLVLVVFLSIYGYYGATMGRPATFLNVNNLINGIATPMSYYAIMTIVIARVALIFRSARR